VTCPIFTSSADGRSWQPTKNSLICSTHFVGGEKSHHPHHPAFVPTIFPVVYRVTPTTKAAQRRIGRRAKAVHQQCDNAVQISDVTDSLENKEQCTTVESATQTDLFIDVETTACEMPIAIFNCTFVTVKNENLDIVSSEVATQASIPAPKIFRDVGMQSSLGSPGPSKCNQRGFHGYDDIAGKRDELNDVSGVLPATFAMLLTLLSSCTAGPRSLSPSNKLLMFLMRLRLGLTFSALGVFFGIHETTCGKIFHQVLSLVYAGTYDWVFWPGRETVQATMPESFRKTYPKCRAIIDCTELRAEKPKLPRDQIYCYSHYKGTFTIKFLVAICPNGFISFVSDCYGGKATDSQITSESKFIHLLEPGDVILADKGFPQISTEVEGVGGTMVMPPFAVAGEPQFSEAQMNDTYCIAAVRVHVERAICRIKYFQVLAKVDVDTYPHIDKIVRVCCALTNNMGPLIR